jgi:hypothetical protein
MISEFVKLLIGFIIIGLFLWILVKAHLYFSKDNIPILPIMTPPASTTTVVSR